MRARHILQLIRRPKTDVLDVLGNRVDTELEPETIKVFSVGPTERTESDGKATSGFVIATPNDYGIEPGDAVIIAGLEYEVDGPVIDGGSGFGRWSPGYVVNVKRVDGV